MPIDPVCGMQVKEDASIRAIKDSREYFFCSLHCKDKFIKYQGIAELPSCCHAKAQPLFKNKLFIISLISILLLLASSFVSFLVPLRREFLMYFGKIWWAVCLGFILGGLIDYYVPREYISKMLSQKKASTIFKAVGLGFLMSACSHGIIALSMQLHKKGASNPAVISFLLASPWANLTITVMLVAFFGLKGLLIIISAIFVAVNTGLIFMFLEHKNLIEKNKNTIEVSAQFSIRKDFLRRLKEYRFNLKTLSTDFKGIAEGIFSLANMVLWWIILGMLIASVAGAYIPVHFFHKFMGPTFIGLMVTLFLATIIEVCSEGSSPLAFEIYRQTNALGNSFVFLMAGVVTDYTEIGLVWSNIGKRTAIWLPIVTVPQVVILGYLFNIFLK